MSPREESTAIRLLRDLNAKVDQHMRDDQASLAKIHACIAEEIRPALRDIPHLHSDVRALKRRMDAADDTTRNLAIGAARAEAMLGQRTEEAREQRGSRGALTVAIVSAVVSAALAVVATLLVSGVSP